MDPMTMMMLAQGAGAALAIPPSGPSSAFTRAESAQSNKLDGANWSVNYGGAQIAGGVPMWLMVAGAALVAVWLLKKR